MSMQIQIGLDVIRSYRRLSYTPWHALAEFVDNSTQAYFDNAARLKQSYNDHPSKNLSGLFVGIVYDRDNDLIRITDNSMGMDEPTLINALCVGKPPEKTEGSRSRYGMGMKTAACWLGDEWKIRTKKLGESKELSVTIDVERIAKGDPDVGFTERTGCDVEQHYTILEISKLRKEFRGKTLGKIKDFLRSMYREDLSRKILDLEWRGEKLEWEGLDSQLLKAQDGSIYKKDFIFEIGDDEASKRVVEGWVGILDKGSRSQGWLFDVTLHSRCSRLA